MNRRSKEIITEFALMAGASIGLGVAVEGAVVTVYTAIDTSISQSHIDTSMSVIDDGIANNNRALADATPKTPEDQIELFRRSANLHERKAALALGSSTLQAEARSTQIDGIRNIALGGIASTVTLRRLRANKI